MTTLAAVSLQAANIVWVSDVPAPGFSGPGTGLTDSGFVTLLQNAGHNVIRFNGPDSQNTLLTPAELAALNTNDLIIIGRAAGSAAWQHPQGSQWNTNVTKPLICMSPYLVRTIAANRMGWFLGDVGPDDTPTVLTVSNAFNPASAYLFEGVAMNGNSTAELYEVPMDRNTSHILAAPVPGGIVYATATFAREDNGAIVTANVIVGFPVETAVAGGSNILAAYRMYLAFGTRESAAAPNAIPFYTGRENLTPTGEDIFLRAVQLAINSGIPPATPSGPVEFTRSPVSITSLQGLSATFSGSITGAAPRNLRWQRDNGDGNFADIPGAETAFLISSLTVSNLTTADSGARFILIASNSINTVTSQVAVLTVTPDTTGPVALSAGSVNGSNITVCFGELLDTLGSATELGNYTLNLGAGPDITAITLRPDGRSVTLQLSVSLAAPAELVITDVLDRFGNPSPGATFLITNQGFSSLDVGAVNPPGSEVACDGSSVQVTSGGLDVLGTADTLRYVYQNVTGDFDVRVRVAAFVGTPDHFETTAKALLLARETTANNSASVSLFLTPPPPGDNAVGFQVRTNTGATNLVRGATVAPSGLPNAWMRIQRVGNLFSTFRSPDGINWFSMGSTNLPLSSTMTVGLGATSHRNGKSVTATFSDFKVGAVANASTLFNPRYTSGLFSASFLTQSNVEYRVQYKNDLNSVTWTTLTNVIGDGLIKTLNDSGPSSPTGQRFYRVFTP